MPRKISLNPTAAGHGSSSPFRRGVNAVRGFLSSHRSPPADRSNDGNESLIDPPLEPPTVNRADANALTSLNPFEAESKQTRRRVALESLRRRLNDRASAENEKELNSQPSPSSNPNPAPYVDVVVTATPPLSNDFQKKNNNYAPPDCSKYPPVPTKQKEAIEKMLCDVWGIAPPNSPPREYQIQAIFYLVFLRMTMLYLIRKTGEGKSLVLLGMATLLRGVTVCLVPLLGVGSMHAANSRKNKHRVEAYHVDEYVDEDYSTLAQRMKNYTPSEKSSILIYISPQNLDPSSKWYKLLHNLASKGYISSMCVDESHSTVEQGESFRPEFQVAVRSLVSLRSVSKLHNPNIDVPLLVMSATFRIPEQMKFNALVGEFPEAVMWGDMDRRSVGIFTRIDGDPLTHLINAWEEDTIKCPDMQSLIMTNSAMACDGTIMERLERKKKTMPKSVTQDNPMEFMSFTGDCGLMMKMFLMECFCSCGNCSDLPFITLMACTAAAQCGVSSKRCKMCYRYGPCPNWFDLVQEAGRVDRLLNAIRGSQKYIMFFNVTLFVSLWVRIHSEKKIDVREKQLTQLFEVLRFVVTPSKCYHEAIEEHFENPLTYTSRGPCNDNCSFCCNLAVNFSGRVSKQHLIGALQANIFQSGTVKATKLVTLLTDKAHKNAIMKQIWGKVVESGKVHGLVLMLIATGVIQLKLKSPKLVGTANIGLDNVIFVLGKSTISTDNGDCPTLTINDESVWEDFYLR